MSDGSETFHNLNIDQMNYRQEIDLYKSCRRKKCVNANVNFGGSPDRLKAEYLDVYEGVYAEVISTDRFDEDMDLSTTYLGQLDMTRNTEVKVIENVCDILVDIGASKSYMPKFYFMRCKGLHSLPKFTSTTKRIQVGNRQYVSVLFVIPVIMTIQNHRFEILHLSLRFMRIKIL